MKLDDQLAKMNYQILLMNSTLKLVINEIEQLQQLKRKATAETFAFVWGQKEADLYLVLCKINQDTEKLLKETEIFI